MHFDDRLATVLRLGAGSETIVRIQYRQLIDLLGTGEAQARGPAIDAAWLRLAELTRKLPPPVRAAILAEPAARLRNPRLVAELARSEPAVAAAAIHRAALSEEQWLDLLPALPPAARGQLRTRRDHAPRLAGMLDRLGAGERALPAAGPATAENPAPPPPRAATVLPLRPSMPMIPQAEPPADGIRAIVRRIEEYRRTHPAVAQRQPRGITAMGIRGDGDQFAAPAPLAAFDFTTDGDGRIDWADPAAAPMLAGQQLSALDAEGLTPSLRRRQPLRSVAVALDGAPALAGDWLIDASPRFDRSGRFTGYRGRMRRLPPVPRDVDPAAAAEADRMRQILHELRTPVNAIQGFAEATQQALFGPISHEYRARAAAILGDAAHILAAFDELDRLVRLTSGALTPETGGCDLASVVAEAVAQLAPFTSPRTSGFVIDGGDGPLPVQIARDEAERLVWRLLAALAGASAPGEKIALTLSGENDRAVLEARLPAALAARDDAALFHAGAEQGASALSAGMFGAGFALRLAAAEAAAAGGGFVRKGELLSVWLPGLTGDDGAGHSEEVVSQR
jgi:two-component system, OmpR family, sensor kinase